MITDLGGQSYAQALAWALVHFLWQGALLGVLAFVMMRLLGARPTARYAAGILTLAAMLATPIATVLYLQPGSVQGPESTVQSPAPDAQSLAAARTLDSTLGTLDSGPWTLDPGPWTVPLLVVWFAGVSVLSLRLLGGWVAARRLTTRSVRPIAPEIQILARRVAARLALDRIVHVFESSAVSVPVMVGWLKPVVLLPTAALSGLTPAQVEALLAHELAHVHRHDYLVNLLQTVVETLLFYHPAVWWVSRQVRAEREHCCDDIAVSVCDRLVYATALAELATMTATPRFALAATDGSLVGRVRRILGVPAAEDEGERRSGWLGVLIILLSVGLVVPVALASKREPRARSAGLESGAESGVAGGVASGVPQGVPGGVPGRVDERSAGLQSGVPGLRTNVAPDFSPASSVPAKGEAQLEQARPDEERRRLELAFAERQRATQEEIAKKRLALELAAVEAQMSARVAHTETQLDLLRKRYEDAKQRVEAGLLTRTALTEMEAQLAIAQQNLETVKREKDFRAAEFEIRKQELEQQRELERRHLDVELAQRDIAKDGEAYKKLQTGSSDVQLRLIQLQRALEELRAAVDERRSTDTLKIALNLVQDTEPVPASQAIAADMVLEIEIGGEPDLPRRYVVQQNGTIRLPLLGVLRVAGHPASQVAEDIRKLLLDRRLAENEKLTVEVRVRRRIRQ